VRAEVGASQMTQRFAARVAPAPWPWADHLMAPEPRAPQASAVDGLLADEPRRRVGLATAESERGSRVPARHAEVATSLTEVHGVVLVEQMMAVGIRRLERAHERRLNR
jgi:hypothetical protein